MSKYYKIADAMVSDGVLRSNSVVAIDRSFLLLSGYKIDAGSPENAKRAFDAIARLLGAEDLLAAAADEGGGEKPAASEPDADGWIPWSGGYCPVPGETQVEIRLHNGTIVKDTAAGLRWTRWGVSGDIAAYRVVQEAPAAEKKDAPWKPEVGELYWTLDSNPFRSRSVGWDNDTFDRRQFDAGLVFPTREEAEAHIAKMNISA